MSATMAPRIPFWILSTAATFAIVVAAPNPLQADSVDVGIGRMLVALGTNVLFGFGAWAIGGVSHSGALAGVLIGTVLLSASGWPAWWLLTATFVVAAGTTRIGAGVKEAAGVAEDRRGRRAAGNVVANTGAAALWALVGLLSNDASLAAVGVAASLATAASDTAASEIGKAWRGPTWRLMPVQIVPPGTNGAVSVAGTLGGVVAAALLGTVAVASGLVQNSLQGLAVAGAATMALGTESVIAVVVEDTGWLDNDGVNFVSSLVGSVAAVAMT